LHATAGENNKKILKKRYRSGLRLVFCNIFKIKFVEMGKPAVPAPYGKIPAADCQIVGTGDVAVPAISTFNKLPEIITANLREFSFFADILNPGDEDPGSPAVVADHPGLVRYGRDGLICNFFTMVTVRAISRKDETFTHGR
jgi:hypothetical protein